MYAVRSSKAISSAKTYDCSESLGLCDNNCEARCRAKHGRETQGSCDYTSKLPQCTCNYSCNPPRHSPSLLDTCTSGAGICSEAHSDPQCNQFCGEKYPRGIGFCIEIGTYRLCECQYPC